MPYYVFWVNANGSDSRLLMEFTDRESAEAGAAETKDGLPPEVAESVRVVYADAVQDAWDAVRILEAKHADARLNGSNPVVGK